MGTSVSLRLVSFVSATELLTSYLCTVQGPSDIIHRIRSVRWSHFGQRSTHIGQDTLSVDEPVSRAVEAPGSSDQHPRILLDACEFCVLLVTLGYTVLHSTALILEKGRLQRLRLE